MGISVIGVYYIDMKSLIYIGIAVGSIAGSWIGSLLDNGNIFGVWGILLGFVGAVGGLWAGYKLGKEYF